MVSPPQLVGSRHAADNRQERHLCSSASLPCCVKAVSHGKLDKPGLCTVTGGNHKAIHFMPFDFLKDCM